eukprot:snap_masked-scaffold_3-processed-gene-18.41-mRNA-1 protein AED:0.08 eAED:0.09 QI:0/-1/0/1/-1/1/1/0/209
MAYSHRPTWHTARASGNTFDFRNYTTDGVASKQVQEQDVASHMKLKFRQESQVIPDETTKEELVSKLIQDEKTHFAKKKTPENYASKVKNLLVLQNNIEQNDLDADEEVSSAESSNESEDDEAELLEEIARIRREREQEENKKKEEEKRYELMKERVEQSRARSGVKRRWDEDIVFRNQAVTEKEAPKRFINDTIRNDFHRKFLNKYIH